MRFVFEKRITGQVDVNAFHLGSSPRLPFWRVLLTLDVQQLDAFRWGWLLLCGHALSAMNPLKIAATSIVLAPVLKDAARHSIRSPRADDHVLNCLPPRRLLQRVIPFPDSAFPSGRLPSLCELFEPTSMLFPVFHVCSACQRSATPIPSTLFSMFPVFPIGWNPMESPGHCVSVGEQRNVEHYEHQQFIAPEREQSGNKIWEHREQARLSQPCDSAIPAGCPDVRGTAPTLEHADSAPHESYRSGSTAPVAC